MSTFTGSRDQDVRLEGEHDLENYFLRHAKCLTCIRVGLEAEMFGVNKGTGQALPYSGPSGIESVLKALSRHFQYEPLWDDSNIIGLKRNDLVISLEPGGQIELSAPPVSNVFQIEQQLQRFISELRNLAGEFPDIAWLACGMQPFSPLEDISWVPKKRYAIMREFLGSRGTLSHWMMKATATNQVNLDYTSEANAMLNLRTALGISSIVTAMFAHSPISEGKPNGYLTRRLAIWNETDPERTGLILPFTKEGTSFRDYLDYVLNLPLIFVVRAERWIPVGTITFRQYLQQGYHGVQPTLADFELHLSTVFPEARIKQYLEVRGIDGQNPHLIPAVAAFWKGIFYDEETSRAAWDLVAFASDEERLRFHHEVPKKGLKASLGSCSALLLARELVDLACASLGKQKEPESRNECEYLSLLRREILRPARTPAETLLEKWSGVSGNSARFIEQIRIG